MDPHAKDSRRRLRGFLALTFLAGTLAAAAGAPVRSSYGARITADEPEYLLTAMSLAEDRSLDVSDEIGDERWRPFHEVRIRPQAKVLDGGRMVSPHDPLLPVLLVPGAAAGGWLGAKLTLSVVNGVLAALILWAAVRRYGCPPRRSALVVCLFAASAPLAVYGSQIYPELPAALAVTVAIVCLSGPLTVRNLVVLSVAIVGLAWLSSKFIPVGAVLAAIALWRLWRGGRLRTAVGLTAFFTLAGAAYLWGHLRWYGGLTVYATGWFFAETGELSVIGTDPDIPARSSRLIGLLVDRRFGLAAWQPAWLLLVPALAWISRKRIPNWEALVLPFATGWLGATFLALTMHGWWFPGRQTVVVLPAAVLGIAAWTSSHRHVWPMAVIGAAGVFNLAWLFLQGWRRDLTMIVDFYETSNPLYRTWARLLPDYIALDGGDWALHAAWAAAAVVSMLVAAGAVGTGGRLRRVRRPRAATGSAGRST
ncbi:MAG TPA: hypothetical protein VHJ78_00880 [Actinomycetota bacterium]|nr:hypothetical protein [Actinomycetota bacterium]